MNYSEYAKANHIKLELSTFRDHWRKYAGGKMSYLKHPQTKAGYESALQEWYLIKATIDGNRPNAATYHHHLGLFGQVLLYWDLFGTPTTERQLKKQVQEFVAMVESCLNEPVLSETVPCGYFLGKKPFSDEFVSSYTLLGHLKYALPDKWVDRIEKMTPAEQTKEPQTIVHWIDAYLTRVKSRVGKTIVKRTASNRNHKLAHFKKYADGQSHVSVINDDYVLRYHENLDDKPLAKTSKEGYFATFKMFVRWCGRQTTCDLETPRSLDSKEFSFREPQGTGRKRQEKKKLLWTVDEFKAALNLPEPYRCYCLLFLNCGFRHVDIAHLQNGDIDGNRIVIQRQKLNQQATAPVISYPLWDATLEALEKYKSSDKLVFGDVENSLKLWWKRNCGEFGLGKKLLNYIRKTGATVIKTDGLADMYLGEALSTTTRISYVFTDGEPCADLDRAIQRLGFTFGLAPEPPKTIEVTPEILEILRQKGINV